MSIILSTPQADDVLRLVAVSAADARKVNRDPAMIDAVTVLGCVDIHERARIVEYGHTGPLWRDVPHDVREDLIAAVQLHRMDDDYREVL